MGDPQNKPLKSANGKYYVDRKRCIMCQVCISMGGGFFEMDWDEESAFVTSQPTGKVATREVREAMMSCPENAINDDGKE